MMVSFLEEIVIIVLILTILLLIVVSRYKVSKLKKLLKAEQLAKEAEIEAREKEVLDNKKAEIESSAKEDVKEELSEDKTEESAESEEPKEEVEEKISEDQAEEEPKETEVEDKSEEKQEVSEEQSEEEPKKEEIAEESKTTKEEVKEEDSKNEEENTSEEKPEEEPKKASYDVKCDKESGFKLEKGPVLLSIKEFKEWLEDGHKDVFSHHVTSDKNDFSSWIEHVFENNELASKLKEAKTIEESLKCF